MNKAQRLIKLIEGLDSGLDRYPQPDVKMTMKSMRIESILKKNLRLPVSVSSSIDNTFVIHVGENNYPNPYFEADYELPFSCTEKDVYALIDEIMADCEKEGYCDDVYDDYD